MTDTPSIRQAYERLRLAFGPQNWWPAESPWEVIVGAILTQSAAWSNVEKAITNLKAANMLSVAGIATAAQDDLARLVYPSGYYNAKARKLQAFARHVQSIYSGDLEAMLARPMPDLRAELLAIHGVGPETADSIALYAAGLPVFVADAYTRRIATRLGLCGEKASYDALQALFTASLMGADAPLLNEFHALMVTLAKSHCRKRPLCAGCPLLELPCATGLGMA